jgi:hypothetical protein
MIGEARNQDRLLTNPKAAERYVQIPLQTVRTRRLLHPVIPPRLRPDKNPQKATHLTLKMYVYFTPPREN